METVKVLAVLQARTTSTRLPGKVLKKIVDKSLIELLLVRLSRSKEIDKIVVVIPDKEQDDKLQLIVESLGFQCYRGSEKDVLNRFCESAKYF